MVVLEGRSERIGDAERFQDTRSLLRKSAQNRDIDLLWARKGRTVATPRFVPRVEAEGALQGPCRAVAYRSTAGGGTRALGDPQATVTAILERAGEHDRDALDALLPLVYEELCGLARRQLAGEHRQRTLDTTGLVHARGLPQAGRRDRRAAQEPRLLLRRRGACHAPGADRRRAPSQPLQARQWDSSREPERRRARRGRLRRRVARARRRRDRPRGVFPAAGPGPRVPLLRRPVGRGDGGGPRLSPRTVKRDAALARAWLYRDLRGGDVEE